VGAGKAVAAVARAIESPDGVGRLITT
jgi:hypothetical protein